LACATICTAAEFGETGSALIARSAAAAGKANPPMAARIIAMKSARYLGIADAS
jgi:hypothetical protein